MKVSCLVIVSTLLLAPGILIASERFDGTWHTRITCPRKGNTEGLTLNLNSVVENGALHGVIGTEGQPGSFVLKGKIAGDGSALLIGNGIVPTRQIVHGLIARKGEAYSSEFKAKFKDTDGTGFTNEGVGLAAGPCTVEFVKELIMVNPGGR